DPDLGETADARRAAPAQDGDRNQGKRGDLDRLEKGEAMPHATNTNTNTSTARRDTGSLRALIIVPLVLATALTIFAWPSARLSPRDLPLGVAGPAKATQAVEQKLAQQGGAFDVHRYTDEEAARSAIKDRDVYGALVPSRDGMTLLTASAASPSVAAMLES